MKNFRLMVAICAALMIAAPAMALDLEVSGHYFVEHFNNSNDNLSKDDSTNDYSSMELMMKPVFKVNDNITLTTQFTALQDHVWGSDASGPSDGTDPLSPKMDNDENFDWKAAYLTIKTGIGGFIVGRYIDTGWGTGLGDSSGGHGSNSYHKDRVMWVVPVGNFISGLVAQKNIEDDKGEDYSDQDYDRYYAFSAYKQENWSTGLLFSYYDMGYFVTQKDLRNFQTGYSSYQQSVYNAQVAQATFGGTVAAAQAGGIPQAAINNDINTPGATLAAFGIPDLNALWLNSSVAADQATYAGSQVSDGPPITNADIYLIDPYFMGTFGPFSVEAELIYGWGTINLNSRETDPVNGETFDELDASALLATIDLKYDVAGFTFNGGYTFVEGDSDYSDDETSAAGYLERSNDLEHGFLLTSDYSNMQTSLGGTDARGIPLGNLAGGLTTLTGTAGYQMFWLGAKYQLLDNLKVGALYVSSKADDAPYYNLDPTAGAIDKRQWDDDHGSEYDFTIEWDVMNNLKFWGVIAYLDAGDYWKAGGYNTEVEDNTTFYGRLTLEF